MSLKIAKVLRESCNSVRSSGIPILRGGPWFDWNGSGYDGVDPVFAALLAKQKLPAGWNPSALDTMVRPGIVPAACELLDVDPMWLYRFFMGYDRNYQIMITVGEGAEKRTFKDEVAEFGMQFAKELFA